MAGCSRAPPRNRAGTSLNMGSTMPLSGLRVVHLSTVHRLSDPRIRLKECQTLTTAGATVRMIARATPITIDDDVEVTALPEYGTRRQRVLRGQREALRLARDFRPDIIHFHDPELLFAALAMRRVAKTVVYDVHESLPDLVLDRDWIATGGHTAVAHIARVVEPALARACSGFVLVDKRWATRFPDRPWAEVHNAPLLSEFVPRAAGLPTEPHFVYVGEILPERGAHSSVRAVSALTGPARLTLAGPVTDALAQELHELDVHDRLELPGLVGRGDVRRLLQHATAGLALLEPNRAYDDATATKLFEYTASGLPMVLSSTTAHRRFAAQHASAVVVPYDDVEALIAAMTSLSDAARWASLHKAASAADLSDWNDEAGPALIDLYQRLVRNV